MAPNQKIEVEFNTDKTGTLNADEVRKVQAIVSTLIGTGSLSGVRGKTIVHFSHEGEFMGVEVQYWPFKVRAPKSGF